MDGHKLWEKEPEGVSRITEPYPLWGSRMFSLGNAVVPQQAYPVLKCIADIETGRCALSCPERNQYNENSGSRRGFFSRLPLYKFYSIYLL